MAIKIENLNFVKNTENEIKGLDNVNDKKDYICFLINKGLEEVKLIVNNHKELINSMENSAISGEDTGHIHYLNNNLFYYETVFPLLMTGQYDQLQQYSDLIEDDLTLKARSIRRDMIAKLDDKYGHLYEC